MSTRHVVLSGCSGGGKSTLLTELQRRGFKVAPEPGRRIVEEELRGDGKALPWVDLEAFAQRAMAIAADDRRRMAGEPGWVFFDRGLVDAAVALQHATSQRAADLLEPYERYHATVFLTPPWPEIYVTDSERQHDLADAEAEYVRLLAAYDALGYRIVLVPKVPVSERADFLLQHLA